MDIKQNILYAKKHLIDSIYTSVKVEGLAITISETKTIFETGILEGKREDDIYFINDLKHAWQYIFEHINNPISVDTVKKLNMEAGRYTVVNAGMMRSIYDEPICVYDSNGKIVFTPELPPNKEAINEKIQEILSNGNKREAAIDIFLYIARGQFFNDGNKRTATLTANMELIQNGEGIFSIPITDTLEFNEKLINYYITGDDSDIKQFCLSKCIKKQPEYTLGQKISLLRDNNNISREDFAKIIETDIETLFCIEKDKILPSNEIINKISSYFNIDSEILKADTNNRDGG